ncbi:unnamed protein product [Arctogadus glacialis]
MVLTVLSVGVVVCQCLGQDKVPRETEEREETEYSDLDIFDEPETPYSTFNFQFNSQTMGPSDPAATTFM